MAYEAKQETIPEEVRELGNAMYVVEYSTHGNKRLLTGVVGDRSEFEDLIEAERRQVLAEHSDAFFDGGTASMSMAQALHHQLSLVARNLMGHNPDKVREIYVPRTHFGGAGQVVYEF